MSKIRVSSVLAACVAALSLVLVAWAASFVDPFSQGGSPATPLQFNSSLDGNWAFTLHSRDSLSQSWPQSPMAGHGTDCAAPPALHSISNINDGLFACKNHIMTTVSGGYGEIMMLPDVFIDWSSGPATLQWNMSTEELSTRDWVDVWLTPFNEVVQMPVEDFIPDLGGHSRNAIQVALGGFAQGTCSVPNPFPGQNTCPFPALHIYNNGSDTANQNSYQSWYDVLQRNALQPDLARRDTFQLTVTPIGSGRVHVKFGMPAYNYFPIDNDQSAVPYTQAVVQLGHHAYDPPKACPNGQEAYPNCGAGTWHWSDVSISPATQFTLIHPTADVYASGTTTVSFQQPAPANAVLMFQAAGNARINGQPATLQTTTTGQTACDHTRSFFMPIAQGTTSVTVSDGGGACIGFYARDFSIVSPLAPGTTPTSAPTPTNTSSPVSTSQPTATATFTPTTLPTSTPAPATPTATTTANRINGWYLHGGNMPWLAWGNDFGGGLDTTQTDAKMAQAQRNGLHVIRWWLFEGGAAYITRDSSGTPTGIQPRVYTDIDAALSLAAAHDQYLEFTLFASPGDVPWFANTAQHQALVNVLTPLFQRYASNPHLLAWEAVNEPNYNTGSATQSEIRDLVGGIDSAVHASGSTLVDVDGTGVSTVSQWTGLGADFYSVHCYGSPACTMPSGLDKPVVIGEMNPDYWTTYYGAGFAGALCWSLSPEHTNDRLPCDFTGAGSLATAHSDTGPRSAGSSPSPTGTVAVATSTPVPASPTPSTTPTLTPIATTTPTATSTPGHQYSQVLNPGDSIQVTCAGSRLTLSTSSDTSDVLVCS